MLINQEVQEKLKSLCDGTSKIIIEGFNGLGDTFTSKGKIAKGKIAKGDKATPAVFNNYLCLDFANSDIRPYSDFVAGFITEPQYGIFKEDLIITKISLENGEVLFENKDAEKYMEVAKKNMLKFEKEAKAEGRWIEKPDEVSKKLMSMVGQPFRIIYGENVDGGVLCVPPRQAANSGEAIINFMLPGGVANNFINNDTLLEVLNVETGKFEPVEFNDPTITDALISDRAKKIKDAKQLEVNE